MSDAFQRLNVAPVWARFNESLIRLVDYVPEDQIDWSPKPELWNFRGIMLHIAATRVGWISGTDGDATTETRLAEQMDVWRTVRTKEEIKTAYARTWDRVAEFLSDQARLDAIYETQDPGEPVEKQPGHWIAFHLLEHDIHHRADIFHYLALLGVEHPDVGTP